MNSLEKQILSLAYENFLNTHSANYNLKCDVLTAETLVKYRNAFSNLQNSGYIKLHFDNSRKSENIFHLLSYEYEITTAGIEAICMEKKV